MFFCDPCATKRKWPTSISKSSGRCEMCNKSAICNDVPSKYLPVSVPVVRPTYAGKHRKDA